MRIQVWLHCDGSLLLAQSCIGRRFVGCSKPLKIVDATKKYVPWAVSLDLVFWERLGYL